MVAASQAEAAPAGVTMVVAPMVVAVVAVAVGMAASVAAAMGAGMAVETVGVERAMVAVGERGAEERVARVGAKGGTADWADWAVAPEGSASLEVVGVVPFREGTEGLWEVMADLGVGMAAVVMVAGTTSRWGSPAQMSGCSGAHHHTCAGDRRVPLASQTEVTSRW